MLKQFLTFLALLICYISIAQTPLHSLIAKKASSGITPPTFVSENETAWNTTTTPKTTASISVNSGDILVAFEIVADVSATGAVSGGSLTWTAQQTINFASNCWLAIWTTTATSTTSFTVSFTRTASAQNFGGNVFVFRNSGGIGASSQTHTTGAPSLSLTTTANNSTVVCVSGDWAAIDGTSTRVWRTVNSITPTSGNGLEKTFNFQSGQYTVYGAYYNNVGTAGANTYGLSAPTGQTYQIATLEIKGQ